MRKISIRNVLGMVVVFEVLFFILTMLMAMKDDAFPILDMMLVYDFDTFKKGVNVESVAIYYFFFRLLDMVFPLVYAAFFIVLAGKRSYVRRAIIIAVVFDYVENLLQVIYVFLEEHIMMEMYILIGATWMKFIWILITVMLLVYYYLHQYLKKNRYMI